MYCIGLLFAKLVAPPGHDPGSLAWKASELNHYSIGPKMVLMEGFEPSTYRFVICCSIQLSYTSINGQCDRTRTCIISVPSGIASLWHHTLIKIGCSDFSNWKSRMSLYILLVRNTNTKMEAEMWIEHIIPFGCVMSAVSVPWLVSAIKWSSMRDSHPR